MWNSQFVLSQVRTNLVSRFERSLSIHSYGYEFSNNHPICIANLTLTSDP